MPSTGSAGTPRAMETGPRQGRGRLQAQDWSPPPPSSHSPLLLFFSPFPLPAHALSFPALSLRFPSPVSLLPRPSLDVRRPLGVLSAHRHTSCARVLTSVARSSAQDRGHVRDGHPPDGQPEHCDLRREAQGQGGHPGAADRPRDQGHLGDRRHDAQVDCVPCVPALRPRAGRGRARHARLQRPRRRAPRQDGHARRGSGLLAPALSCLSVVCLSVLSVAVSACRCAAADGPSLLSASELHHAHDGLPQRVRAPLHGRARVRGPGPRPVPSLDGRFAEPGRAHGVAVEGQGQGRGDGDHA
eukprot:395064-Rhodomonas_salina.1